jgi:HEPN domain-containing protein
MAGQMEPEPVQQWSRHSHNFWAQARADLATATTLLDAGVYYASVFFSQQAAEKALKAMSCERQKRLPRGHNLIQMANGLGAPVNVMNSAAELNIDFLNTRNPDNVDGVPATMYDKGSARLHLRCAQDIIDWVAGFLP